MRRQSVLELSRLGGELQPHGRQTAHLTLALFDRLKPLHRLNPALWREPLNREHGRTSWQNGLIACNLNGQ